MYILFAISSLCFIALAFAAVAIARRVRSSRAAEQPQHDFAHHLYAAAADQDLHTPRNLTQQSVKNVTAKKSYRTLLPQATAKKQSISSKSF